MLFLASDHAGFELKNQLTKLFQASGIIFTDLSPEYIEGDDYPIVADILAQSVLEDTDAIGVAICGTGQGICMALNRNTSIRAGITNDPETVIKLREHNDANILCLSGSLSSDKALKLVQTFLETRVSLEPRHVRRRQQLDLDRSGKKNN